LTIKKFFNKLFYNNRRDNLKKEKKMATPIAATPTLSLKESRKFLENIKLGLNKPVGYVPTPKLTRARKLIKEYARQQEK
jgi:hypothetical protein